VDLYGWICANDGYRDHVCACRPARPWCQHQDRARSAQADRLSGSSGQNGFMRWRTLGLCNRRGRRVDLGHWQNRCFSVYIHAPHHASTANMHTPSRPRVHTDIDMRASTYSGTHLARTNTHPRACNYTYTRATMRPLNQTCAHTHVCPLLHTHPSIPNLHTCIHKYSRLHTHIHISHGTNLRKQTRSTPPSPAHQICTTRHRHPLAQKHSHAHLRPCTHPSTHSHIRPRANLHTYVRTHDHTHAHMCAYQRDVKEHLHTNARVRNKM